MVSVEYIKSTARLKESILTCEAERLNLEKRLKAIKDGPTGGDNSTVLSAYYRDLCQRETTMQARAEAILEELSRSEASFRSLARKAELLRSRRDQILRERAPQWRDEFIDFLRRKTSEDAAPPTLRLSGSSPVVSASGATLAGTLGGGGDTSGGIEVPPLHLSQLSRSSGSTGGAGGVGGGGGGGGGGWNTSGALLGLTESTMDSTAMSRIAASKQQQHHPKSQSPAPPTQKTSALDDADAPSSSGRQSRDDDLQQSGASVVESSRPVSDLTISGLMKLLDFIDSEMERARPQILTAYYSSSPPSDALRQELCRAANGPGGLPSHISAVSATCLLLEELELVVATRLPAGCVFPDRMVPSLSAVLDAGQLERQIDMNLPDEARQLWGRLLTHMRRLVKRTKRSGTDVATLFCPALLQPQSAPELANQLVRTVARILDLSSFTAAGASGTAAKAGKSNIEVADYDDEDDESVTIASDKLPAKPQPELKQQKPTASVPKQKSTKVVGESLRATAGSFADNSSESDLEETAVRTSAGGQGALNVTGNPELRASESDAYVKAYAAALHDDSGDESSVTDLTGTNRSGFFSHHSPQKSLKDSTAYQKMLYGALGVSANLDKSSEASAVPGGDGSVAAKAGAAGDPSQQQPQQSRSSAKPSWLQQTTQQQLVAKDDHDLESDMDSELENSFRMRLSGGGTFKSLLASDKMKQQQQQQKTPTHVENDDEDFGGFFD